jgi:hypothetical protein
MNAIEVLILSLPALAMAFFHFRKLYFHLEFAKLHDTRLREETLIDVFINPFVFFQVFYIFIPIFIKSPRKKAGRELELETKIGNSLTGFWTSLALTILTGGIMFLLLRSQSHMSRGL